MSETRAGLHGPDGTSPSGPLPHGDGGRQDVAVDARTDAGHARQTWDDQTRQAAAHLAARYWRRNLATIAVLMAIGFAVTFIGPFWARDLSNIRFLGWPLPFYLGAQGALLTYLLLVICYAGLQRRNDLAYRRALAALRAGVAPSGP